MTEAPTTSTGTTDWTSWLDRIFNTGATLGASYLNSSAQQDAAKTQATAAQKAAAQQAALQQAQTNTWIKLAMIGGAVLAAVAVLAIVLKRK